MRSAAALSLACLALEGCKRGASTSFRTEELTRGPISEVVSATGDVSAIVTVNIGSQVSGIVSKLYVDFNSQVKKGQPLADLDPRLFAANLSGTKAKVLQARADRDMAAANLEFARIRSPIDGIVVSRAVDVGQTVAASFQTPTMFTIANDLTKMQVLAHIDEADVGKVHEGAQARFTVDAYPGDEFSGVIREVRQAPNTIQNVVTYDAVIDASNPERKLRQGMTAAV